MQTMQEMIQNLNAFWAARGCVLMQPYNTEVGAGTWNPATSLRVLGPEKWSVAYVEPSVRPDDSRYGENPNRLQTHTQYQVVLKPEPGNPQQVYLDSLTAIGIDLAKHDVRFVEDNWASPGLGAWGLGWEVWLDGMEISQFTYFQQSGTQTLDPVPVELTYGLERIAMGLQGVDNFKDIEYAPGISYGDFMMEPEYEMSRFYLDTANVATQRTLFDLHETEAKEQLEHNVPQAAHYCLLKMSHAFNVLDARGAVGLAERANAFSRMRNLATEISVSWIEQNALRGHKLGIAEPSPLASVSAPSYELDGPATFALEIGVEELPPSEIKRTIDALRQNVAQELADARLEHGEVHFYGSPRRLILVIDELAARQLPLDETIVGPKVAQAYDADGNPSPALLGFARKNNIDVGEVIQVENKGNLHIAINAHEDGANASEVLAALLPGAIAKLSSSKNMRWNAPGLEFSRPIRTILALHGEHVVPFAVSNMAADRITRVHRNDPEPERSVATADELLSTLRAAGIEPDAAARKAAIVEAATAELAKTSSRTDFTVPVLDEIVNLVEDPHVIIGSFDESYLDLPTKLLTDVMIKHQRYLPVTSPDGAMAHSFIAVANGRIDDDTVRIGNERVISARYADAAFFWRHDLQVKPEEMAAELETVLFQADLGSMTDHVTRSARVANTVAASVAMNDDDKVVLQRAAQLLKFDLGSQVVTEMTSLSGYMAREYAVRSGESPAVGAALYEAETGQPSGKAFTPAGALLAAAERVDALVGLFAVGARPTGSSDPSGLRRAAGRMVAGLMEQPSLDVSLRELINTAAQAQSVPVTEEHREQVAEFIERRFTQILVDDGHQKEAVRAVAGLNDRPAAALTLLGQLEALRPTDAFKAASAAYKRAANLAPASLSGGTVDAAKLSEPSEVRLHEALTNVSRQPQDLQTFTQTFATVGPAVNEFLDSVEVNSSDPVLRENRLALLARTRQLGEGLIAWDSLPDEQLAPARESAAERSRPATIVQRIQPERSL